MRINPKHIVISEKNRISALYAENSLKELKTYNTTYNVGDIYFGKLESGLSNINAAFIKLQINEKNGFIQLHNLVPTKFKKTNWIKLESLRFNESVLIQITKEPTGSKGPSLTTNLGLNGDYIILLPFGEGISISNKIYNFAEKQYLRAFINILKPLDIGILVKKEACGVSELCLREDFLKLLTHWYQIQAKIKTSLDPYILSGKIDFIKDSVKNFYDKKVSEISIDSLLGAWKVYKKVLVTKEENPNLPIKIKYYCDSFYFMKYFSLDLSIYYLIQSNLTLSTGGSIVIEKTEALTAIDINSGSFNYIKNSRATLLWINCEAATEIANQLKLRNIGGIIVIDFIDMAHQKDQMKLLTHLNSVLQTDEGYTKIIQLSEIGLIELTRKREGQNIYDAFSYKCYKCNGLGYQIDFGSVNINKRSIKEYENYHNYINDFIKTNTKTSLRTESM